MVSIVILQCGFESFPKLLKAIQISFYLLISMSVHSSILGLSLPGDKFLKDLVKHPRPLI